MSTFRVVTENGDFVFNAHRIEFISHSKNTVTLALASNATIRLVLNAEPGTKAFCEEYKELVLCWRSALQEANTMTFEAKTIQPVDNPADPPVDENPRIRPVRQMARTA